MQKTQESLIVAQNETCHRLGVKRGVGKAWELIVLIVLIDPIGSYLLRNY